MPDKSTGWALAAVAVVALAVGFAASSFAYRYGLLGVPRGPFIERIQRELKLTPAQHDQVLAIVNETRSKVMNLREEFQRQRRETILEARARVRALLTPEQQEKFDREFKPPPEHYGGPGMHDGESTPHRDPHEDGGPPP